MNHTKNECFAQDVQEKINKTDSHKVHVGIVDIDVTDIYFRGNNGKNYRLTLEVLPSKESYYTLADVDKERRILNKGSDMSAVIQSGTYKKLKSIEDLIRYF